MGKYFFIFRKIILDSFLSGASTPATPPNPLSIDTGINGGSTHRQQQAGRKGQGSPYYFFSFLLLYSVVCGGVVWCAASYISLHTRFNLYRIWYSHKPYTFTCAYDYRPKLLTNYLCTNLLQAFIMQHFCL